jgi:hypothetical protein
MRSLPPVARQWLWFVGLWAAGVASVILLGLIIKLALR